jgi:ribosomal protein S18 acetylase RimI-like enzyme
MFVTTVDINQNIQIIPYNEDYAEETVRMWRDSKEKAIGIKDIHDFEDHLNFLKNVLVNENKVFLAIDGDAVKVVGILAVAGNELNQLYIHTDYQGIGIGSRLLELAKELSGGKLRLFTFEVNKGAQAFYEKHGFKIIGRGFENEENLPDIRYEWKKI